MNSISNKANQLIIGSLLGDSSINRTFKTPRIHFSHSDKQKDYLYWKYNIFIESKIEVSTPNMVMSGMKKKYPQWRFQTRTSKIFEYYLKLFYPKGKKVVTRKTLNLLDPLGLAIWYMDDGNLIIHKYQKKNGDSGIKSREVAINTQCFSYEEHEIIQRYFLVKWGIQVKIYKNKGSYRIVMNATNAKIFFGIIEDYIISSMKYKVDLQYS
ncbi:LAGLIDADG endonuclease [Sporosarcina sp. CAU 1771]